MSVFEQILEKARAAPKRIVLAEGRDSRVVEAAVKVNEDGIAKTILICSDQVARLAIKNNTSLTGVTVIDPDTAENRDHYAGILYQARAHKGMTLEQAKHAVLDPLCYANVMTHTSDADGCVAGAQYTTSDVVRTALQIIGKDPDYNTVSSFFIMIFNEAYHQIRGGIIFADCALTIDPDADQLSEIAVASADSAQQFLGLQPRVALLSFSTAGSAAHPLVDKVVTATERAKNLRPNISFAGEVQLDAALIPEILARKSDIIRLDGPANVLIFPSLEAGNIGYKIAERMGGAQAIGPILQGLRKPANDVSRGCNADDIYKAIAVTVVQAQNAAQDK